MPANLVAQLKCVGPTVVRDRPGRRQFGRESAIVLQPDQAFENLGCGKQRVTATPGWREQRVGLHGINSGHRAAGLRRLGKANGAGIDDHRDRKNHGRKAIRNRICAHRRCSEVLAIPILAWPRRLTARDVGAAPRCDEFFLLT